MANYIEMPKLADTMIEGTLVKWRKNEGDKVEAGDIVAEVETDKATMEMETHDDGVLHKHLVQIGQKVPVGARLALLLSPGEKPPMEGAETDTPPAAEDAIIGDHDHGSERPGAEIRTSSPASKQLAPATRVASGLGARVKASPLAKKIAAERGVELAGLQGSGPGGRIVAADVENAKAPTSSRAVSTTAPAAIDPTPAGPGDQRIPLSGMRRVIAERLLLSKTTIPHFYLTIEVDAGPLMKLRAEANAAAEAAKLGKLTVNDFVLRAVIAAAVKVPAVNASFAGDAIIQYGSVGLSVAVAVDDGLVTPVLRDAQTKSLREISDAVKDLATRARGKKLKPDEYQGGTITVSNLGSYGIESFSAIVNPPQSLIISVGAIVKKPVVGAGDTIIAGQRMSIGLSADHRVVDGAIGAQYLAELRKLIENPTLMLF